MCGQLGQRRGYLGVAPIDRMQVAVRRGGRGMAELADLGLRGMILTASRTNDRV
jgi:hypothetical protein